MSGRKEKPTKKLRKDPETDREEDDDEESLGTTPSNDQTLPHKAPTVPNQQEDDAVDDEDESTNDGVPPVEDDEDRRDLPKRIRNHQTGEWFAVIVVPGQVYRRPEGKLPRSRNQPHYNRNVSSKKVRAMTESTEEFPFDELMSWHQHFVYDRQRRIDEDAARRQRTAAPRPPTVSRPMRASRDTAKSMANLDTVGLKQKARKYQSTANLSSDRASISRRGPGDKNYEEIADHLMKTRQRKTSTSSGPSRPGTALPPKPKPLPKPAANSKTCSEPVRSSSAPTKPRPKPTSNSRPCSEISRPSTAHQRPKLPPKPSSKAKDLRPRKVTPQKIGPCSPANKKAKSPLKKQPRTVSPTDDDYRQTEFFTSVFTDTSDDSDHAKNNEKKEKKKKKVNKANKEGHFKTNDGGKYSSSRGSSSDSSSDSSESKKSDKKAQSKRKVSPKPKPSSKSPSSPFSKTSGPPSSNKQRNGSVIEDNDGFGTSGLEVPPDDNLSNVGVKETGGITPSGQFSITRDQNDPNKFKLSPINLVHAQVQASGNAELAEAHEDYAEAIRAINKHYMLVSGGTQLVKKGQKGSEGEVIVDPNNIFKRLVEEFIAQLNRSFIVLDKHDEDNQNLDNSNHIENVKPPVYLELEKPLRDIMAVTLDESLVPEIMERLSVSTRLKEDRLKINQIKESQWNYVKAPETIPNIQPSSHLIGDPSVVTFILDVSNILLYRNQNGIPKLSNLEAIVSYLANYQCVAVVDTEFLKRNMETFPNNEVVIYLKNKCRKVITCKGAADDSIIIAHAYSKYYCIISNDYFSEFFIGNACIRTYLMDNCHGFEIGPKGSVKLFKYTFQRANGVPVGEGLDKSFFELSSRNQKRTYYIHEYNYLRLIRSFI